MSVKIRLMTHVYKLEYNDPQVIITEIVYSDEVINFFKNEVCNFSGCSDWNYVK